MASDSDIVWYFRVELRDMEGAVIVRCAGRVSHRTCAELERALADAGSIPARGVVLDLSGVDYISSPGLRAIEGTSAQLTAAGRLLVVCGLSDAVTMAFSLGGLTGSVRIESTVDEALTAVRLDTSQRDV